MPAHSTVTILSKLNTHNPESCKEALRLLAEHFFKEWKARAKCSIRKRLPDQYFSQEILTYDIINAAYINFSKYVLANPENAPRNRAHVEAMFANNIRFAISEAIRRHVKHKGESSLDANFGNDDDTRSGDVDPANALVTPLGDEYWEDLERLFAAIDHLSKKEYKEGSGLDPVVLCERRLFLQESFVDIETKYGISRKTIASYWGDISRTLQHEMAKEGSSSEYGTRPQITKIVPGSLPDKLGFHEGDVVLSCNRMIFFSGIALTMHMMHMMERLQNSTEKKYDCEIVLEQK